MKKILETLKRKWAEYLLEMVVIIFGILGAYMLNNWNESIKSSNRKGTYIQTLLGDLRLDSLNLSQQIKRSEGVIEILNQYSGRLSKPTATIDTVLKIARNDFRPYYSGDNTINNTTYTSLMNTGEIELLDGWLIKDLTELNLAQLELINSVDVTLRIYRENVNIYWAKYPFYDNMNMIQGHLLDELWTHIEPHEFIGSFNTVLTSKRKMEEILIDNRKFMFEKTNELLDKLKLSASQK